MKLTRVGFVLLAVMALTLLASASAVQGAKAPKAPHYKVLVVTAGDKKSQVNRAGVKAIKAIGGDAGTKADPNSKFSVALAQDADPDQRAVHREAPRQVSRRHLPRHRRDCPAQRRAEGHLRGVLPQRRRLPRDRLGDRDRARLAVLHGHPRRSLGDVRLLRTRQQPTPTSRSWAPAASPPAGRSRSTPARTTSRRRSRPSAPPARPAPASRSPPRSPSHTRAARPSRCPGRRTQSATIKVADRVHDATKTLPEYWDRTDGWWNFTANVRGVSHVLATVVEDPFGPQPQGQVLDGIAGGTMGADHPVSWCKDYKGGRSFYTALGNTASSFGEANLRTHLTGAIDWAAGVADPVYSDCGATVLRELPAGQDQRAAEPERADRLRPAPGRAGHPDRPPRRRAPARPGGRHDARSSPTSPTRACR